MAPVSHRPPWGRVVPSWSVVIVVHAAAGTVSSSGELSPGIMTGGVPATVPRPGSPAWSTTSVGSSNPQESPTSSLVQL